MPESKITGCNELNGKAIHREKKKGKRKKLPGICQQQTSSQKMKVKNDQNVFQNSLVRDCNWHHDEATKRKVV